MNYDDYLETVYEYEKKTKEIKEQPIELKLLFHSLSVSNNGIKYYIKKRKQETNLNTFTVRGGKGNQISFNILSGIYWENEEVSSQEWLSE